MKRAYEKICATILVSLCLGPPVSAEPLPVKQPGRMVTSNTDEVGNVCGFLRDFTPLMSREQRYTSGGLRVTGRPPQTELSPSPAWPNLQVSAPNRAPIVTAIGKLAPVFVENIGQVNEDVKFYLRNSGETLWITDKGIVFDLVRAKREVRQPQIEGAFRSLPLGRSGEPQHVARERLVFSQELVGIKPNPMVQASRPQPGTYNYFLGNDPAKWRTGVRAYAEIVYREIWDGIDLSLYSNGRALEQEFIVRPGGDATQIRVAYRGTEGLRIAEDGSLVIKTAFGEVTDRCATPFQFVAAPRAVSSSRVLR